MEPATHALDRTRLSLLAYNQRPHILLDMAGMQSSPVEPAKAHPALLGRGGVGNYQEAKKWENIPSNEPPVKIDPVVTPRYFSVLPVLLSFGSNPRVGYQSATLNWPRGVREL